MTRTRNPKGLIVKIFCPRILRLLNQRRQLEGMKERWWKKNENRKVKHSQKQNTREVTFSSQICEDWCFRHWECGWSLHYHWHWYLPSSDAAGRGISLLQGRLVHSHWSRNVEALIGREVHSVAMPALSYAIKFQLKACKNPPKWLPGSLWHKDRWLPCMETTY